ncbi:Retrovirus-related Pol polyprotein from transposon RE1 [Sesamum angolense]|uniref:Retrovirus-related Pol polyprotein from transposon RE1 n=1 Tax=Sesamum angolense TaxID=2727404 RepID=A0AAE1T3Z3_9LAMI|nr:Retrovirus-related Pol polyprotein from transposon RE1 [Sesamum angolense]
MNREAILDIDSDKWLEAMKSEIDSMGSNQARLVAKGYNQRPRVDFEETYSPLAMAKFIRILLAIATRSKQATMADSIIEFEYIVASEAAKEVVWMKNYIKELGTVPSIAEPIVIFYDNNEAIAQTKEPRSHH